MLPKAVRLVTFAWGEQHVKDMLNYALASALAPGNLPAIARRFDCTVAVVTEAALFDFVRESETGRRIEEICTLKLIALDDLLAEPWQYGMTLTKALFRGMDDLGPAMTGTYFLFLNADFILSDGCYERLVPRIEAGERLHLSPSYCTVEEAVAPILLDHLENGVLCLPPRELAALILEHRHNTIKAKTVNQGAIEFEHSDQFYWAVNENTLLGHQMPIAVVGMQPTVALKEPGTFWDWGLIYDFCPDKLLRIIGDSDEFLMLEMRPQMRSAEHIVLGRSSPKLVAKRMTGYITQYQVDNARFSLTLHSGEIPEGDSAARLQLEAYVDTVLRHLPKKPIEHSNHAQWIYHTKYFRERLARRYLAIQSLRLQKHQKNEKKRPRNSRRINIYQQPLGRGAALWQRIARIRNPYRSFIGYLREEFTTPQAPRVLAVCESGSPLLYLLDDVPGLQTHLTPDLILEGALELWPREAAHFDFCLVEPPIGEFTPKSVEVLEVLLPHVVHDGKISLLWHAAMPSNPQTVMTTAIKTMSRHPFDVDFECRSFPFAVLGRNILRASSGFPRWGRLGRWLRMLALGGGAVLLLAARLTFRAKGQSQSATNSVQSLDNRCAALIVNLKRNPLASSAGMYVNTDVNRKKCSYAVPLDRR